MNMTSVLSVILLVVMVQEVCAAKQDIRATADVIIGQESNKVLASDIMTVRYVLFNNGEKPLKIKANNAMGKEQFQNRVGDGVVGTNGQVYLAYTDMIRVRFVDGKRSRSVQHVIPFPFSGVIAAKQYVEIMFQVPTPELQGNYDVEFQVVPSKHKPIYNAIPLVNQAVDTFPIEDIQMVTIKDIRIATKKEPSPIR